MTLLVGAHFPWEDLRRRPIFRSLATLPMADGIILAADSRWTFPDGRTEDGAVKLFGIAPNAIATYAGSAAAGEDAITGLSTRLEGGQATIAEWSSHVATVIDDAWQRHQPNEDGLEILLAYSYPSGLAWLGHFSSANGFRPQEVTDIVTIGPETARLHFSQALRAAVAENTRSLKTTANLLMIEFEASLIVATLTDVCELRTDEAVGGKVLCAATILGKPQGIGVTRLMPTPGGVRVDELGLNPRRGQTLSKDFKYTPPSGESG